MALTTLEQLADSYGEAVPCERCGYLVDLRTIERRYYRNLELDLLCSSCKATPQKLVRYGNQQCTPWTGDVDLDTMQPLQNGKPFMPGERSCGHLDCVNKNHVTAPQVKTYRPNAAGFNFEETYQRIMAAQEGSRGRGNE